MRVEALHPQAATQGRTITQPGSCQSFEVVKLFAKVSGFLKNQHVDIGDQVKAGELLLEIDAPEIQQGVLEAQASLEKAKAVIVQKQAAVTAAESDVKAAQAKLQEAKTGLDSAQAETKLRQLQHDRIQSLAKDKAIEQELVDEKTEALGVAQADEASAKTVVNTAQANIAAAQGHLAEARADLTAAQADEGVQAAALKKAKQFVDYTQIKSPIDGIITARNFYNGDFIRAANSGGDEQELLRVASLDKMRVIVQIPDQDAPLVHRGTRVTLQVGSLGGEKFESEIARTSRSQRYESRTMRAEFDIANPHGVLQDGMFGTATIQLEKTADCVIIPSQCVNDDGQGHRFVYLVKDDHAQRRVVSVEYDDGVHARVAHGLKPTDLVVSREVPGLTDGTPVAVISSDHQHSAPLAENSESKTSGGPASKEHQP